MSDTPAWLEDEFEPRPRRRLVVVGAAAAVVWVVLALAVFLLGDDGRSAAQLEGASSEVVGPSGEADLPGDDEGPSDAMDEAPPSDATAPREPQDLAGDPGDGRAPGEVSDGHLASTATTVSRDAAEAVAVAVTRAWLSDGGPDLLVPGIEVDRRAYLEHVSIEGFDLSGDELAVARLQLVLLVRDDDHYTEVTVRRAAVPLTLAAGTVSPAGQPWFLPGVAELRADPPETTPLDDPDVSASVTGALTAAGYLDVEVGAVATTVDGSLVVQVQASTPEGDAVDGPVWLAHAPEGLVLLGARDP